MLPTFGYWTFESLRGTVPAFVAVVGIHTEALLEIIFPMTWLLILRLLLRRTALAVVGASLLGTILFYPETGSIPGYVVGLVFTFALFWGVAVPIRPLGLRYDVPGATGCSTSYR